MYVCMYVCIYLYVCMYVCMYVCKLLEIRKIRDDQGGQASLIIVSFESLLFGFSLPKHTQTYNGMLVPVRTSIDLRRRNE